MTIPEQYTTENTGFPAGTWLPGLYFTTAYIKYAESRDRHNPRVQHGAVRVEQGREPSRIAPGSAAYVLSHAPRRCAVCDRRFVPTTSRQILCGQESCKRERNRQVTKTAYVPHGIPPRTCVVCGAQYQPVSGIQRTCGPECRDAWTKRKKVVTNRDYRERRKGRAA